MVVVAAVVALWQWWPAAAGGEVMTAVFNGSGSMAAFDSTINYGEAMARERWHLTVAVVVGNDD